MLPCFLYGSFASSPHQAATLSHGQCKGYVNLAEYVITIILLTANLTHLFSPNLKFQPLGIEFAHQLGKYFYAI